MDLKTFKSMYSDGIIYEILNRLDKKLKMNNLLRDKIERSLRDPELVKTLAGARIKIYRQNAKYGLLQTYI